MNADKPKTVKFSLRHGAVRIPAPTEANPDRLQDVVVEKDSKGRSGKPVPFEVDASNVELVKMLKSRDNIDVVK